MFRLGYVVGDCWCEHSHAPVYDMQPERITATVPDGDPIVLKKLSTCLRPPFLLLYILHTPRGEAEPGRYQSDAISPEQLFAFVERFGSFLRGDGRYELWLHSPADAATIAWDRHNLLFAYGPLADYEAALRSLGFTTGAPTVPAPHTHHYREEFDTDAAELLQALDWQYSPLEPQDEQ